MKISVHLPKLWPENKVAIFFWNTVSFRYPKTNGCHIGILLPAPIFTLHHYRRVILHNLTKFHPNRNKGDKVMTSCAFSKWRLRHRNSTSVFIFDDVAYLGRTKPQISNMLMNLVSPESRFNGLHFCCRLYMTTSIVLGDVTKPETGSRFVTQCPSSWKIDYIIKW